MFESFDRFLSKNQALLQSMAIALAFCSSSLIYFLRDGIRLAPGNSLFTLVVTFGLIFFLMPFQTYKKLYRPNVVLYYFIMIFMAMSLAYLLVYVPNRGWFTNTYYQLFQLFIIFCFYLFLLKVPQEAIDKHLVKVVLIISTLGSLSFLYFVIKNPVAALSNRAAVAFEGQDYGNPHMFARPAFFGFVACMLFYKQITSPILKFLNHGALLVNFFIVVLTQTFAAIFSFAVFCILYFYFSGSIRGVFKGLIGFFKNIYVIAAILVLSYSAYQFIQAKRELINIAIGATEHRIGKITDTFVKGEKDDFSNIKKQKSEKTEGGDVSANARINNVNEVLDRVNFNWKHHNYIKVLFGNGFQNFYVDVPTLETLDSFGIIGFVVFCTLFLYTLYLMFQEMRRPKSNATLLIAYCSINLFVINFTFGLVADYYRWVMFALVARFLYDWKTLKTTEKP